ncbi:ABC transporter substrate-binding protein [Dactylosporangium sp. NPDC049140]|uniref:ABC transporter substrate-binding protein n=1 Tax=Dactylosporangium sp. NPDC049140 TaxID=3155647 RepID=UPI0033E10C22
MLTRGHRPAVTALVLATALLMSACTGSAKPVATTPANVAIGLLVPTSGPNAQLGQQATLGARLAIEVVNRDVPNKPLPLPLGAGVGLHGGTKITLLTGDTASAPEKIEKEAGKLVDDGAVGLVLADTIDVAQSTSRSADYLGVSLVDALSTSDSFAENNRNGHFRIQPTDRSSVNTALDLLYRYKSTNGQIKRVVTAAGAPSGELIGKEVANLKSSIEDLSQAAGYDVAGKDHILPLAGSEAGQPNGQVQKGDAVLAIVTTPAEASVANDLAGRLKGTAPVIAIGPGVAALDGVKNPVAMRTAGWSNEFAARNPTAQVVGAMFEQAYHTKLTEVAADAFMATLTLVMAMDQASDYSKQSVRNAVQQLTLPATQTIMPWNGVRFDGTGVNQLAAAVVEQRTQNGYMVVYPAELSITQASL